jgi:hypothetical protein
VNNSPDKTLAHATRRRLSPSKARRDFEEGTTLLFGDLFMELVAYADESGIHDPTGTAPGSREMTVGGIVAPREDWSRFCAEWQRVLNKYRAPCFHFWEWTIASEVARKVRKPSASFQKNPYRHLTAEQLNDFVIEMATIAGSGNKLIVGVGAHTSLFHKKKTEGNLPPSSNPYEECVKQFFDGFPTTIAAFRAPWKRQRVTFFFDRTDDRGWMHAISDAFHFYGHEHSTFKELVFSDKMTHLPLQAADMVAYRARKITGKWVDKKDSLLWPEVDTRLFKSVFDHCRLHDESALKLYFSGVLEPPNIK